MLRRTTWVCWLFIGCGGPAIEVAPAPPATKGCEVLDPPKVGLLKPGVDPEGMRAALPQKLSVLLTMRTVPTKLQWRALPPTSDAELVQAAGDAKEDPKIRVRAMAGLAVRTPDGGDATMRAALADAAADGTLRRGAARALAAGYLVEGLAALTTALGDPDHLLREAVVKALTPHVAQAKVRAALEARRGTEEHPLVMEALNKALGDKAAK